MGKAKKSWYAVLKGMQPGLYRSWDECKTQVDRYPGAIYMGFFSREEAINWIRSCGGDAVDTEDEQEPAATAPAQLTVTRTPLATRSINGLPSLPPSSAMSILSSPASFNPAYYAVARGRQPGLYRTWDECRAQVDGFSDARYKKFKTLTEATEFLAVYGGGGHFSQFTSQEFKPDVAASFGEEWARLSQSQGWTRGTKHYSEQRACALRNELQTHFFASSSGALPAIKNEDSEEEDADVETLAESDHRRHEAAVELHGFQSMCQAVRKSPGDTVGECKRILQQTLVNIVDLIDTRRAGREFVATWTDFEAFKRYTLSSSGGDKTIPAKEAKKDPLLKCFLQNFRRPRGHRDGGIGGGAEVKKRARSQEDDDSEDGGHQNKKARGFIKR
ncbi:putative ribonuclease h [Diaporthe ampelina]|uniref:Ribonuclease H n=1 Tax=Diaporthe ampelina TaxID=1214573 RepID=A0A0G2F8V3_9PEZI|nr:putative ribonuclease h [Diaporthe ampelina]